MTVYQVRIAESVERTAVIEVSGGIAIGVPEVRERLIEAAHDIAVETERSVVDVSVTALAPGSAVDANLSA